MNAKDATTHDSSAPEAGDEAPDLATLDLARGRFERGGRRLGKREGRAAFRRLLRKRPINMLLDETVIEHFRRLAGGRGYQTLINEALREAITREGLEAMLRRIVREEIAGARRVKRRREGGRAHT